MRSKGKHFSTTLCLLEHSEFQVQYLSISEAAEVIILSQRSSRDLSILVLLVLQLFGNAFPLGTLFMTGFQPVLGVVDEHDSDGPPVTESICTGGVAPPSATAPSLSASLITTKSLNKSASPQYPYSLEASAEPLTPFTWWSLCTLHIPMANQQFNINFR